MQRRSRKSRPITGLVRWQLRGYGTGNDCRGHIYGSHIQNVTLRQYCIFLFRLSCKFRELIGICVSE